MNTKNRLQQPSSPTCRPESNKTPPSISLVAYGQSTVIHRAQEFPLSCRVPFDPDFVVDAGPIGGIARFFNHSCAPNLYIQPVRFVSSFLAIPRRVSSPCESQVDSVIGAVFQQLNIACTASCGIVQSRCTRHRLLPDKMLLNCIFAGQQLTGTCADLKPRPERLLPELCRC